jgi:hypothetical protein
MSAFIGAAVPILMSERLSQTEISYKHGVLSQRLTTYYSIRVKEL